MVTLVAALTVVMGVNQAVAAPPLNCTQAVVIPVRGSGETSIGSQTYGTGTTGGWEGPTLSRLLKRAYESKPEIKDVPVLDVDGRYLAVAVPVGVITNSFDYSITTGVRRAIAAYDDYRRVVSPGCSPQVILLGYSQGATVARGVANALKGRGVVTAVMTVGDPNQKPNADGVFGSGSAGSGIWRGSGETQKANDGFYSLPNMRRASICHQFDPVCDWSGFADLLARPHKNYFNSGVKFQTDTGSKPSESDEVDFMANALAVNIRIARERNPVRPNATQKPKDTVFAIDTTGSMSGLISSAKAQADTVARRLLSAGGSRVALVEFRDHGDDFVSRTVTPFTSDIEEFGGGLSTLVADGGGDWPEAVFSGIVQSLGLPFSSAAARSVIVIGDAPAHDPEPITGYTAGDVVDALGGKISLSYEPPGTPFARVAPLGGDRNSGQSGPSSTSVGGDLAAQASRAVAAASSVSGPGSGLPVALYSIGSTDLTGSLSEIASESGGRSFDIGSSEDIADSLNSAIDAIDAAPTAVIDSVPFAALGLPTFIGCGGSYGSESPLAMEFEIEGRIIPCVADIDYTFMVPGPQLIRLRVTDASGRTATAESSIMVAVPEESEGVGPEVPGPILPGSGSSFGTGSSSGLPFGN
ncbi:cutinase family protein [Rhodococcus fascians]|nr:cutinase family protein [Rhodococcus fascians]MBY4140315.1 cutinase family protein [Rhodococcus fascians]MBY4218980.1 cutinase family protein [Rhodococcus fascians]MBY4223756.1 cutinase family protein [Rhodococcus fascians]MBY4234341.1 cutinase family protein [Rhodococcus fascians]